MNRRDDPPRVSSLVVGLKVTGERTLPLARTNLLAAIAHIPAYGNFRIEAQKLGPKSIDLTLSEALCGKGCRGNIGGSNAVKYHTNLVKDLDRRQYQY